MASPHPWSRHEILALIRNVGKINAVLIVGLKEAIISPTGDTTLTLDDDMVLVDTSGGAVTITLPPAADAVNKVYTIKNADTGANAVTVDGDGSETIDGSTTAVLGALDSITIVSDGTEWWIK